MIFVKLKWLPWIFIAAGVYGLFSGEWDPFMAIIFIVIGGAGAYFFYGNKKGSSPAATSRITPSEPIKISPNEPVIPSNVCPGCGAPVEEGMIFCSKCGTKVR